MIHLQIFGQKNSWADLLQAAADCVFSTFELCGQLCVELEFVSSAKIKQLNSRFRGINKPTDVLSFPFLDLQPQNYPKFDDSFAAEMNEQQQVALGSIAICTSVAKKQAAEFFHSPQREIVYLFVHGLLHLLGFDHLAATDKKTMRTHEEKIMSALNLSRQKSEEI